ncbi:MAG: LysR family transcriptional regulator [Colwellia sp.]|nr:LysR family transcriptional regulator [Colwellia sp.]
MKVFIEVAKQKSFVGASTQLNLSAPAVTRYIAFLENALGIKLFNRTTRHVCLTESGAQYLNDSKRIIEEINEAEAAVSGIYTEPRGTLTVTAPVLFGEQYILPIVIEFLKQYPDVQVKTLFSDRITSLVEEDLDIAIRIGHLKDSNLYASQVGVVRRIVCGSPEYFSQNGKPISPSDLKHFNIIFSTTFESSPVWHFANKEKKEYVKLSPRLYCNQNSAALNAAIQGFGITRLMSYQVGEELAKGTLQSVLTNYEEAPLPINIIRIEGRRVKAKTRAFLDLAMQYLKINPFINPN